MISISSTGAARTAAMIFAIVACSLKQGMMIETFMCRTE